MIFILFYLHKRVAKDSKKKIRHVGIIMDGNGRWAKERLLPRITGHEYGARRVKEIVEAAWEKDVEYLTLWAFSYENWARPKSEVDSLMALLGRFLKKEESLLIENRTRLSVIGRPQDLPPSTQLQLEKTMKATETFRGRNLILALSYGSRKEILDAVSHYVEDAIQGKVPAEIENWDDFSKYLYTHKIPDPDLIIRTSGERRISNFLLLQAAYAEFYTTPVYWPDFTREHFYQALEDYQNRERRYGLTSDQIHEKQKLL